MKLSCTTRVLFVWSLYFSVLFSAFACSIGHGQLSGLQLSGMDAGYCSLDHGATGSTGLSDKDWGVPMPSGATGCLLCSSFSALILAAFFGLLGLLPRSHSALPLCQPEAARAVRFLWPSANPRASPLLA